MSQLKDVFGNNSPGPGADTFLGLPACDDLSQLEAAVAIISAPIAAPYPSFGTYVALSPTAIRAATNDYAAMVGHHDFEISDSLHDDQFGPVVDAGDLATSEADFAGNRVMITGAVKQILHAGAAPIVLGGDDSVPIPVFKAFESCGPYPILQIDAHIDWRDEVNGERLGLSRTMRRTSELPWIKQIIQVGMRSTGSAHTGDVESALAWGQKSSLPSKSTVRRDSPCLI